MNGQTTPQYSADGRWWWDGAGWRPVEQARKGGSKDRRPRTGLPGLLIVGLVAVASLVIGFVGGSVVGNAASQPAITLLKIPSGFPNASQSVLPKVTVPGMRKLYESQDHPWPCEADGRGILSEAPKRLTCSAPWRYVPATARGSFEYDDDTHVRLVRATCDPTPQASKDWCNTYFGYVADALFLNQESLRKPAMDWAVQNTDSDNSTTMGGIHVEIKLSPHEMIFTPQG